MNLVNLVILVMLSILAKLLMINNQSRIPFQAGGCGCLNGLNQVILSNITSKNINFHSDESNDSAESHNFGVYLESGYPVEYGKSGDPGEYGESCNSSESC